MVPSGDGQFDVSSLNVHVARKITIICSSPNPHLQPPEAET